jgi:hypothetical protein
VSDIDTAVVDSLKVLDLKRPIREADIAQSVAHGPNSKYEAAIDAGRFIDSDKKIYRK